MGTAGTDSEAVPGSPVPSKLTLPAGAKFFVANARPYLPVGALGEAVCYPMTPGVHTPAEIDSVLRRVGLGDWAGRLGVVENWDQVFSVAQQQRLSFARMLLLRPDWIFLSATTTSALDAAAQREMAELLVKEFPSATIVAAGRVGLFDGFFQRVLHVEAETASA